VRIRYIFSLQLLLFPVFHSDILDGNNLEVYTVAQAERVVGGPPVEKSSPKPPEQLDLEAQLNALSGETPPTNQKPPAFGSANSKTSASSATNSNKAGVATKLFASANNTSNSSKLPTSSTGGKPPSTTIPTVSSAKPYAVNNKPLTAVNNKAVPNSTSIPTAGSSNGPAGGASIASKQTAGAQSLAASTPLLNAGSSPSSSKTPTAVAAAAAAQQQQRIGTAGPAARKKGEEQVFFFFLSQKRTRIRFLNIVGNTF
jgi:hypothetical protein